MQINKYSNGLAYWVICLLVVLVVFPKKALASELSLGVYPPIMQIVAQPPAKIDAPLIIQNLGDDSVDLEIVLRPFTASEKENGEIRYLSENDFFGENPLFFQHVQIREGANPIQAITLAPQQQKKLSLHIEILKDEPPSDYYFSVVFISKGTKSGNANSSEQIAGIGINILMSIGPKGEAKGILEEFSSPFILEKGPVPFTVRVKNTSDHFITPRGRITITNMFGQSVGKVDLLPVNILAHTTRAIPDSLQANEEATPAAKSEIRNPKFEAPKAVWPETFILGPYTATLTIALSDKGPSFIKTINFVGLPIQTAIGLIIALVILLLIRARLKSRLS